MMILVDYDTATGTLISANEYIDGALLRAELFKLESAYLAAGIKSHKVFMAGGPDFASIKRGFSEFSTIDDLIDRLETELTK